MREELISWSLIAPTPQCYYHSDSDSYIVYWRGVAMARTQAMNIVQEMVLQAYASPAMKQGAFNQFKNAYLLGAFGNVDWDYTLRDISGETHHQMLKKLLWKRDPTLIAQLQQNFDAKISISWFTKDYVTDI